jgi:hypothetical protein
MWTIISMDLYKLSFSILYKLPVKIIYIRDKISTTGSAYSLVISFLLEIRKITKRKEKRKNKASETFQTFSLCDAIAQEFYS